MKFIIRNLLFLSILFGSSASFSASKNKETYEYLDLFGKVFDRVRSEYVEEVTDQELIEKAIDGMLTGLDPHSGYMNEEVWQEMQMDTQGKFGGLGIEITMEEGFVKVISPIEDSPAYEAGILAGDFIIQIDETPVFGLTLNEAVELMRGERGASIMITISRENTEPFEIEIIRDYIFDDIYARVSIKSIVITGGASKIFGLTELSQNILNRKVRIGTILNKESFFYNKPEFSTILGLIKLAQENKKYQYTNELLKGSFFTTFDKLENWIEESYA